jgi:hypothetical protein
MIQLTIKKISIIVPENVHNIFMMYINNINLCSFYMIQKYQKIVHICL